MVTIVRLITDVATGDKKGIMYVKDIDAAKHRELDMIAKADRDVMTGRGPGPHSHCGHFERHLFR